MDFPIHIDAISMGLTIVHFKGSQGEFLSFDDFLSLQVVSILINSADPYEMQHCAAFHLGLHCLSKYLLRGFQYTVKPVLKGRSKIDKTKVLMTTPNEGRKYYRMLPLAHSAILLTCMKCNWSF